MWPDQPFEKQLHKALRKSKHFDSITGDAYFDHYKQARNYLVDQIYPNIPAIEPDLTDHTEKHIRDVMKNAHILLSDYYKSIDCMDLYLLGLGILVHDTGNVFGRDIHSQYDIIAKVYDDLFHKDARFQNERRVITTAASAHSGKAKDGSKDTLKDVSETDNLDGLSVRLREMAALLRFADELAEGPQRTSQFMQQHHLYKRSSEIFHKYANCVNVHIDRPLQRIALTYHFKLNYSGKSMSTKAEKEFRELLAFTYSRIQKMNQERNYARHYSTFCGDFKRTTAVINIEKNGRQILTLTDCVLEDRVIPGQTQLATFESQFESYQIDNVIKMINQSAS